MSDLILEIKNDDFCEIIKTHPHFGSIVLHSFNLSRIDDIEGIVSRLDIMKPRMLSLRGGIKTSTLYLRRGEIMFFQGIEYLIIHTYDERSLCDLIELLIESPEALDGIKEVKLIILSVQGNMELVKTILCLMSNIKSFVIQFQQRNITPTHVQFIKHILQSPWAQNQISFKLDGVKRVSPGDLPDFLTLMRRSPIHDLRFNVYHTDERNLLNERNSGWLKQRIFWILIQPRHFHQNNTLGKMPMELTRLLDKYLE